MNPDSAWDLHAHLLAGLLDVAQVGNWQRGGDPHAPKPKPIQRPGVKGPRRYGKTNLPPDEARRILAAYRRGDYAKAVNDGD